MPFKSQAQRRWMYSQHPEMAEKWEKETPKGKKLPTRLKTAANHAAEAEKVRSTISGFFEAQGLPSSTPYVLTAGSSLFFHGFRPERGGDVDLYIPGMKKPHATAVINGVEVDAYNSWMGFGPALL